MLCISLICGNCIHIIYILYILQMLLILLKPVYTYSASWTEAASCCHLPAMTYQTTRSHKASNQNIIVACSQNPQSFTIL